MNVIAKVVIEPYGMVKLVRNIGRILFSVGKLTTDPGIDEQIKGSRCKIKKADKIVALVTKGDKHLYIIKDSEQVKVQSSSNLQSGSQMKTITESEDSGETSGSEDFKHDNEY